MQISDIRLQLMDRRRQILEQRKNTNASWQELKDPAVEFEENATNEKMAGMFEQLDTQEKTKIEQIDRALGKIETASYGQCDSCGENISESRLKVIPWTPFCIDCAENQEAIPSRSVPGSEKAPDTTWDTESFTVSDTQIREMIADRLQQDGRIEDDELNFYSKDGWVHLEGSLPSTAQHELLIAIVQDTLGFKEIVDHIKVDRQLWERQKYTQQKKETGQTWEEKKMQGENGETDVWTSSEFGTPLDPPDRLDPEKGTR